MTKHSKVLFLLAFGAVVAAAGYAWAKTCFIVGDCGGGISARDKVGMAKKCIDLGYQNTETCRQKGGVDGNTAKLIPDGKKIGDCWEKCVCNPDYYAYEVNSENGLTDSANKKYVISDKCNLSAMYHSRRCNVVYKYPLDLGVDDMHGTGDSCTMVVSSQFAQQIQLRMDLFKGYGCPAEYSTRGDELGGFDVLTSTKNYNNNVAKCYKPKTCSSYDSVDNRDYRDNAPSSNSGYVKLEERTKKVGRYEGSALSSTQSKTCYAWREAVCSDLKDGVYQLQSGTSCSEGYKAESVTGLKLGSNNNATCYKCVKKTCEDTDSYYSTVDACYEVGRTDWIRKYVCKVGTTNNLSCYKRSQMTCADAAKLDAYGYGENSGIQAPLHDGYYSGYYSNEGYRAYYDTQASCTSGISAGYRCTEKVLWNETSAGAHDAKSCWYREANACTDYSGYYANESTCKSGIPNDKKCQNETTTANVGGLTTCYKRVTKGCTDYSGYYASESTCKSGIPSDKECQKETATANVNGLTTCYKRVAKQTCTYTTQSACESAKTGFTCAKAADNCYYPSSCKSPYSNTEPTICKSYDSSVDFERVVKKTAKNSSNASISCYTKETIPCNELRYHGSLILDSSKSYGTDYGRANMNPMTLYRAYEYTGGNGCGSRICSDGNDYIRPDYGDIIVCNKSGSSTVKGAYKPNSGSTSGLTNVVGYICYKQGQSGYKSLLQGDSYYVQPQ